MSFQVGDKVGDYRIVGAVGSGGAGQVFRVEHKITGRLDAMKVLLHGREESKQAPAERFQREIKLQASLNHPNIASVHNAFWVNDELVMVMELIDGVSLDHVIAEGPMPPGKVLRFAVQALTALDYAHEKGITHRDIKPENIMITPEGGVKLMDFGLAKDRSETKLTQTGAVVGSLYYISPEQARGLGDTDHRADIYSFGAVLYEMVTGAKPFPYNSSYALLQAAVNEDPRPPTELEPSLPTAIDAVVLRAMSKDPDDRFPSAREFRKQMEAIARNPGIKIHVEAPKIRKRRRPSMLEKQSRRQLAFRALFVLLCLSGLLYLGVRALSKNALVEEVVAYQNESGELTTSSAPNLRRTPRYELAQSWELDARGAVSFSSDARLLAAGLEEGGVAVWDLRSGNRLATLTEADARVAPAFDPSGRLVAVAGRDNSAHVYQIDTAGETRRLAHLEPVTSLAFSPDGRRVATGSADDSIRVWDLESGESLGFRGPDEGPKAVVFSPTGPMLASAEMGLVRLWGLGVQDSREELDAPGFDAESLEFSRNGLELAAVAGVRFMLWDMPTRKRKLSRNLDARIVDIRQSPSGDWLALTLDSDGKLKVWDPERRREVASLANAQALTARFGGETQRVAAAGLDGKVTLWKSTHANP